MGGEPYWYYVKYESDIDRALQNLREKEFKAGRYNPTMPHIQFPLTADSPAPGPKHSSIDEAREDAAEDGTRSILDLDHIAAEPEFFAAAPLSDEALADFFGTTQPTREEIGEMEFFEEMERGHGVYIILYKDGKPDEILFAGYSFD